MKNVLFPLPPASKAYSLFLLAMRLLLGILFMRHGIEKLYDYELLYLTFPDPVGYGSELALIFVIFTELCCALAIIFGVLYRLCLIPIIAVLAIAFFYVHGSCMAQGELAFSYMMLFVLMFIAGPGRYSVDTLISYHLHKQVED